MRIFELGEPISFIVIKRLTNRGIETASHRILVEHENHEKSAPSCFNNELEKNVDCFSFFARNISMFSEREPN